MATKEKNAENADKKEMKTSQQTAQEILDEINKQNKDFKDLDPDQRMAIIYDFNEKNKEIAEMVEEPADEEFMNQCKKDFEEYQNAYIKLDYELCKSDKALEYAKWLKEWNTNHVFAPQNYWIGILKFDEEITKMIGEFENTPEEFDGNFNMDYGMLTYLYNLMMAPVCRGIEEARWMAENQETYNAILNKIGEHIDTIELIKKKIGLLQIRWAMACQGFKINILAKTLEDFREKSAVQTAPAQPEEKKDDK